MVSDQSVRATEEWVKDRIDFKCGNLADVRTLTLNGTFQEKITHLGTSISGFLHLRVLDLSRNALVTLQGLEHLRHLEKLNIYYNNIADFDELKRLRANQRLVDLDVRLNPICRQDTDFRLHLINILQGLQRLDDRTVRESEIKAAATQYEPRGFTPKTTANSTVKVTVTDAYEAKKNIANAKTEPKTVKRSQESDATSLKEFGSEEQAILDMIRGIHLEGLPLNKGSLPLKSSIEPNSDSIGLHLSEMNGSELSAEGSGSSSSDGQWGDPNYAPQNGSTVAFKTSGMLKSLRAAVESAQMKNGSTLSGDMIDDSLVNGVNGVTEPNINSSPLRGFQREPETDFETDLHNESFFRRNTSFTPNPSIENSSSDPGLSPNRTSHLTTPPNLTSTPARARCSLSPNSTRRLLLLPPINELENEADSLDISRINGIKNGDFTRNGVTKNEEEADGLIAKAKEALMEATAVKNNRMAQDIFARNEFQRSTETSATVSAAAASTVSSPTKPLQDLDLKELWPKLLNLVDKYWNGFNSLHCHARFLSLASKEMNGFLQNNVTGEQEDAQNLAKMEELKNQLSSMRREVEILKQENERLHRAPRPVAEIKRFNVAQNEIKDLQRQLDASGKENGKLRVEIRSLNQELTSVQRKEETAAKRPKPTTIEELTKNNDHLQRDLETAQIRLRQFNQMQELASMLQESHRALVQTNDHILTELREIKQRNSLTKQN